MVGNRSGWGQSCISTDSPLFLSVATRSLLRLKLPQCMQVPALQWAVACDRRR